MGRNNPFFKIMLACTERVCRDTDPELYDLFMSTKKRFDINIPVILRKGDIGERDGLAFSRRERSMVLLSDLILDYTEPNYLKFVIGHELGHVGMVCVPDKNEDDRSEKGNRPLSWLNDLPESLMIKINNIFNERFADLCGLSECDGIENVLPDFEDRYPRHDVRGIFITDQCSFPPLMVSGFDQFPEIELQMLKIMIESDIIPSDERDVFSGIEELSNLLKPLASFTDIEDENLTRFTESAISICYFGKDPEYMREKSFYRLDGSFDYYLDRATATNYANIDEAVRIMDETKHAVKDINHPMKYEAFKVIAETAFQTEKDKDCAESFIFEAGQDMGFPLDEILECKNRFR